jgi:adenylylsulfate kinase-like enzyme
MATESIFYPVTFETVEEIEKFAEALVRTDDKVMEVTDTAALYRTADRREISVLFGVA